ncbi:MAG: hypothetical protein K2J69_01525 [Malacoplasma sp.]|nr:hypothetical protein [Malacoplasma sp.]MDE6893974.1 hypothetical protein [Malacoplasma sp.]MDE7075514.1 hypothetical protein [Malacoplasma sp.]
MYRNRKKIIAVSIASVVALGCFGTIAWGIVYASHQKPEDSVLNSELSGSTSYLGNGGTFQYGKMSFNDWLIYTAPRYIESTTENNVTSFTFYSSGTNSTTKSTPIATLTRTTNGNNASYVLSTAENKKVLVSSEYKKESNLISFADNFDSWNKGANQSYNLNLANSVYSNKNSDGVTLEYSTSTTDNNSVYTYKITSNTDTLLWQKQTTVNGNTTTVNYSSQNLTTPLIITYIKSSTGDIDSYAVSYSSGGATLSTQEAVLRLLISNSENSDNNEIIWDFNTSKLTSKDYSLYIPEIF